MIAEVDINEIEIKGSAMRAFTDGLPEYLADFAHTILHQNNISELKNENWYSLGDNLRALKELDKKFGKSILYELGKGVVNIIKLPYNITSFTDVISKIEEGFNMFHRDCDVCKVDILKLSMRKRKVLIKMENPYPFELNRGILAGIARKYPPHEDDMPDVEIDESKSIHPLGHYKITW